MNLQTFTSHKPFLLESGKTLNGVTIAFHSYGKLNKEKSNVLWVCHALTANSDVFDWWKGLFGENDFFNSSDHFIVCANIIGSGYGSTGPLAIEPGKNSPYYSSFPELTVRDLVAAHELLRNHLGLEKINTLIGGSLGGQQALEWAVSHPDLIENLIVLATNAQHSPWGIAFNESQRLAIAADSTWHEQSPEAGQDGLRAARSLALLSYRNYSTYLHSQSEENDDKTGNFRASSYQNYQGEKLVRRFNAYSYWILSKTMDSHNLGRNRGGVKKALSRIRAKTLVIGIASDLLFPVTEQQSLAQHIPGAIYLEIDSLYGHDGFLIETGKISKAIAGTMQEIQNTSIG